MNKLKLHQRSVLSRALMPTPACWDTDSHTRYFWAETGMSCAMEEVSHTRMWVAMHKAMHERHVRKRLQQLQSHLAGGQAHTPNAFLVRHLHSTSR